MLHGKRKRLPWEKLEIGIIRILERIFYFSYDIFVGGLDDWKGNSFFWTFLLVFVFFKFGLSFPFLLLGWWFYFFFCFAWLDFLLVSFCKTFFFLSICLFFFLVGVRRKNPVDWIGFDSIRFGVLENSVGFHRMLCVCEGIWVGNLCPLWVALGLGGWDGGRETNGTVFEDEWRIT